MIKLMTDIINSPGPLASAQFLLLSDRMILTGVLDKVLL